MAYYRRLATLLGTDPTQATADDVRLAFSRFDGGLSESVSADDLRLRSQVSSRLAPIRRRAAGVW
jgi:hypothetical protein